MRPTPLLAPRPARPRARGIARLLARVLAPLVAAALLVGCTGDPEPTPTPSPSLGSSALPTTDPDREALEDMVVELRATVTALRSELEAAADGDADALRAAAELLVADVEVVTTGADDGAADDDDGGGGFSDTTEAGSDPDEGDDADATSGDPDGPGPILPGPRSSREESIQYGDLLTRTLAAARGAGPHGEPVVRFLAEPLAGDLGSWQRSPADQLAAIAQAGTTGDLTATEAAVLELGGEAPRALAWVVHGLTEPTDATDAAGRALAHLAIIELSLEQLE